MRTSELSMRRGGSVGFQKPALCPLATLGLSRIHSHASNERFDGRIVRKLNGDRVKIAGGESWPL